MKHFSKQIPLYFLVTVALLIFNLSSQSDSGYEQIGNVVFSILPPDEFNQENEGVWVLMDGTPLEDSINKLTLIYGIDTLPNANGRFPRIMDLQKNEDRIDIDRSFSSQRAGDLQEDATSAPTAPFQYLFDEDNTANRQHLHTHHTTRIPLDYGGITNTTSKEEGRGVVKFRTSGHNKANDGIDYSEPFEHQLRISGGGDTETRPKNIILYAYIKIN